MAGAIALWAKLGYLTGLRMASRWLSHLNAAQREAVRTLHGPLLVFAGIWSLMQGFNDILRAFQIRKLGELV